MKKLNKDDVIARAIKTHSNRYDYSKVEYKNRRTKICIVCPEHGEFWQYPLDHIGGQGCPECAKERIASFQKGVAKKHGKDFEEKSRKIHGNKYDYTKVDYKTAKDKVCIICPKHGEFWQTPNDHLTGYGCPKCGFEKTAKAKSSTTNDFIEKARKVHNDKYDYSKTEYVNNKEKVCIICPKHGEFWQSPAGHLAGKGCPRCQQSRLEQSVEKYLKEKNIQFVYHKKFDWLKYKKHLHLDFYIPSKMVAIECQGMQHYKPVDFSGRGKEWADKNLEENKERDKIKKDLCEKNNIKLIYFNYNEKINVLNSRL